MFTSVAGNSIRTKRTVVTTRFTEELVRIVESLCRAISTISIDSKFAVGAVDTRTLEHGDAVSDVIEVALEGVRGTE
jgi:hypothetical protein